PPRSALFPYTTLFRSLAHPLAVFDVRDGGWHGWSGWVAGLAWLLWKAWRRPAWRKAMGVGVMAGSLAWGTASWALSPDDAQPPLDRKSTRLNSSHVKI